MLRWYLVHTKPSGETLAQANLVRQGYDVYLPQVLQRVRNGGRIAERIVALFPRYLFLRLREGLQTLGPVRSSVGVASIVRFGASYAVVPDPVVRNLKLRADPESGLHRVSPPPALKAGAAVKIESGPFDGLQGVFEREAGSDRVVVLLNLLGQHASVRVPARFIVSCVSA
jgi:transcriptional antiterminator RfaH